MYLKFIFHRNNIEEISADDGITLDGIDILKLHSLCNGNQTIFAMLICNNEMPAIVKLVRNDNPIVSYVGYNFEYENCRVQIMKFNHFPENVSREKCRVMEAH